MLIDFGNCFIIDGGASTIYNDALKSSGYKEGISYTKSRGQNVGKRKNRSRSIIWFNPPYSADIETNVAKNIPKTD